jgi:hypothetical protein
MQCAEDCEEESEYEEEESEEECEEEASEKNEEDSEGDGTDGAENSEKHPKAKNIAQIGKESNEDGENCMIEHEASRKNQPELFFDEITVGAEIVDDRSVYMVTNSGYGRYSGQVRTEERRSGFGSLLLHGEVDSIIRSGAAK